MSRTARASGARVLLPTVGRVGCRVDSGVYFESPGLGRDVPIRLRY
jgi:hypothetical protein